MSKLDAPRKQGIEYRETPEVFITRWRDDLYSPFVMRERLSPILRMKPDRVGSMACQAPSA